jgi:nucleoside-diphosphate-sugar epimerase
MCEIRTFSLEVVRAVQAARVVMPHQGHTFIVIGGAGLIGSAVARALSVEGLDVIICDRFGRYDDHKWAYLPNNLADIWAPEVLLPNLDRAWRTISGVVVLADAGHQQGDMDALMEAAYHLPRRVWDFCTAKQRPLYWASSLQVYGGTDSDSATNTQENAALNPVSAFGRVKQAFDGFAAHQGQGPDTPPVATGFRLASVYGSNEHHKGALASLPYRALECAKAGTPLTLWQNSEQSTRDWIHADDAASLMVRAMVTGSHRFIDVGTGKTCTTQALVETARHVAGVELGGLYQDHASRPLMSHRPADMSWCAQSEPTMTLRTLEQGMTHIWQTM